MSYLRTCWTISLLACTHERRIRPDSCTKIIPSELEDLMLTCHSDLSNHTKSATKLDRITAGVCQNLPPRRHSSSLEQLCLNIL